MKLLKINFLNSNDRFGEATSFKICINLGGKNLSIKIVLAVSC